MLNLTENKEESAGKSQNTKVQCEWISLFHSCQYTCSTGFYSHISREVFEDSTPQFGVAEGIYFLDSHYERKFFIFLVDNISEVSTCVILQSFVENVHSNWITMVFRCAKDKIEWELIVAFINWNSLFFWTCQMMTWNWFINVCALKHYMHFSGPLFTKLTNSQ
jgi:hypothetical protein